MLKKLPFNLLKQARRDPPTTFDYSNPLWRNPYREDKGKPGSGAGSDLLRPGSVGFSNTTPSGGAALSDNKEWPSSPTQLINDEEGRENHDNGTGAVSDNGIALHDGVEPMTDDAPLGRHETVGRNMDDNKRDRKPYNVNSLSVLKSVRSRLRSL